MGRAPRMAWRCGCSRAEAYPSQGVAVELILIGNKGCTYFKRRETPVRKMIPCGQQPTAEQARIASLMARIPPRMRAASRH